jgi:hypothetical protein
MHFCALHNFYKIKTVSGNDLKRNEPYQSRGGHGGSSGWKRAPQRARSLTTGPHLVHRGGLRRGRRWFSPRRGLRPGKGTYGSFDERTHWWQTGYARSARDASTSGDGVRRRLGSFPRRSDDDRTGLGTHKHVYEAQPARESNSKLYSYDRDMQAAAALHDGRQALVRPNDGDPVDSS